MSTRRFDPAQHTERSALVEGLQDALDAAQVWASIAYDGRTDELTLRMPARHGGTLTRALTDLPAVTQRY